MQIPIHPIFSLLKGTISRQTRTFFARMWLGDATPKFETGGMKDLRMVGLRIGLDTVHCRGI